MATSFVLIAVHVCRIVAPSARKRVVAYLRRLRDQARSSLRGRSAPSDKFKEEIAARTRQLQMEQFRSSLPLLAFVFLAFALLSATSVLMGFDAPSSTWGAICLDVTYACLLLLLFHPKLLFGGIVDIWFLAMAVPLILVKSPAIGAEFPQSQALSLPHFLLAALQFARMDIRSTCISAVLSCLSTLSFLLTDSKSRWSALFPALQADICINVAVALACWLMEHWARRTVRADFQVMAAQEAFRALLRNFYEVVLEVDEDLKIVGPSPDLGAFLLYGTGTKLDGRNFEDFVREDDRGMVVDALLRQGKCPAAAEALRAQMRGVEGHPLDAELFLFTLGGMERQLVGLREHGEDRKGLSSPEEKPDPEEVSVTVDTSGAGFPSLRTSPAFEAVMGPTPHGTCLLPRLSNWQEFSGWVQAKMNAELTGESPPDSVASELTFRVKFKARAGVQTRALCRIVSAEVTEEEISNDDDSEDHLPLPAKLLFSDLERCRRRRAASRSGNSSGTSSASSSAGSRSSSRGSSSGSLSDLRQAMQTVEGARAQLQSKPPMTRTL